MSLQSKIIKMHDYYPLRQYILCQFGNYKKKIGILAENHGLDQKIMIIILVLIH